MIYLKLFWAFFQIGLFSIGGGYAAMPLIQNQIVNTYNWLTITEFADVVTISQMTPGPISINAATFVGTRIAGVFGAVIATLGCVFPSFIIVLLLAALYKKYKNLEVVQGVLGGLRPAVVGLIASAGITIIILALWGGKVISFDVSNIDIIAVVLITICVITIKKLKVNPTYIILGAGVVGGLIYSFI